MRAEARNRVLEALLTLRLPVKPWKTLMPAVPIYGGIECSEGGEREQCLTAAGYRYGAAARLKVTLTGNRIQELDRRTDPWSDGLRLCLDNTVAVRLSPGDGRLLRVVTSEDPSSHGKNAVY